jgi:hypothetical protein
MLRHLGAVAAGVALTATSAGADASTSRLRHAAIVITPRVVAPYDRPNITVGGLSSATSVEVEMLGATDVRGARISWLALTRSGRVWKTRLPQPARPGIYPIALRTRPDLHLAPTHAFVRFFDQVTAKMPLFATPMGVTTWWVTRVVGGWPIAVRRWAMPADDHRLRSLHRLFVVAYRHGGAGGSKDRLGAWITVVREGYRGRWRLLTATVAPP